MKKPIIIGNWKANPKTLKEAKTLLKATEKAIGKTKATYGFAVPDLFITSLQEELVGGMLGSQTIGTEEAGPHTSKNLASQVKSSGASFTLLGHSEVRAQGETGEHINALLKKVCAEKLQAIICVGEHKRDAHGAYLEIIETQIKEVLYDLRPDLAQYITIAYEPLWAIGASKPASVEECFEVVIFIRRVLATLLGIDHAKKIAVLYGGDVNKDNAEGFLVEGGADGLLIGRASLDPKAFASIVHIAHEGN